MTIRIRTITIGVGQPHPLTFDAIARAAEMAQVIEQVYSARGYEIQTLRVSTRPLFTDLAPAKTVDIIAYTEQLQKWLSETGISYLSLGPALADESSFPLEYIQSLPRILANCPALNATVQIASTEFGLNAAAALPTAQVMLDLSKMTSEGIGNMRFAMTANCPLYGPFFPAAFHPDSTWGFSIGLQSVAALQDTILQTKETYPDADTFLAHCSDDIQLFFETIGRDIEAIAQEYAAKNQVEYYGLDLSPAPNGEESIAYAIEAMGLGAFGAAGSIAALAQITSAIKGAGATLKTCGYNGIFLPALEDAGIAARIADATVSLQTLELLSTVCGSGLDTIPIAGNAAPEKIAATLLDVAALSLKHRKPLSARLMPIPGKQDNEIAVFDSPWLYPTPIVKL